MAAHAGLVEAGVRLSGVVSGEATASSLELQCYLFIRVTG